MNNFNFQNPTRLVFGKGQIDQLANLIPADKNIMITYGGGSIFKNGIYDQVKEALKNHQVSEFGGIEPNPEYETLMRCVALCREKNIDFLLAVGGGSVIDGTKFIATALKWEGEPWDFLVQPLPTGHAVPLAAVLTIPATGSEMNSGSVISRRERKEKLFFFNDACYPQFSILDPTAIYSLPKKHISNGIHALLKHSPTYLGVVVVGRERHSCHSEGLLQLRHGVLSLHANQGANHPEDGPGHGLFGGGLPQKGHVHQHGAVNVLLAVLVRNAVGPTRLVPLVLGIKPFASEHFGGLLGGLFIGNALNGLIHKLQAEAILLVIQIDDLFIAVGFPGTVRQPHSAVSFGLVAVF